MRPNTVTGIEQTGNLTGLRRSKASIDNDSLAYLMEQLSDLYPDAILASIREPSINGLDSHIAAGNDDPIEVTLPNAFDPTFVVRDKGVGMTSDEVLYQYSMYGYSSKRDNDDETGMFGLGCKAPLAYTDQFTVVATKNGVQSIVLIAKNADDGVPDYVVMSEEEVDAPNGVEVRIPVRDRERFNEKAKEFFKYWDPGKVLVDGVDLSIFLRSEQATFLDDDVLMIPSEEYYRSKLTVVMGNIPYRVQMSNVAARDLPRDYEYIARVPMGSVNFPLSREELKYTDLTVSTIRSTVSFINDRLRAKGQEELDAAPSKHEALKLREKWRNILSSNEFTYKGEKIPFQFHVAEGTVTVRRESVESSLSFLVSPYTRVHYSDDADPVVVLVTNHTNKMVPTRNRQKLREAANTMLDLPESKVPRFILVPDDKNPYGDWFPVHRIDWADVRRIRLKDGKTSEYTEPTYQPMKRYQSFTLDKLVAWLEAEDLTAVPVTNEDFISPEMHEMLPKYVFIPLGKNRVNKLLRSVPRSATFDDARNDFWERLYNSLPENALLTYSLSTSANSYSRRWASLLQSHRDEVLDPSIRDLLVETVSLDRTHVQTIKVMQKEFPYRPVLREVQEGSDAPFNKVVSCYPLVDEVSYRTRAEDVVEYINAVYQMRQEQ